MPIRIQADTYTHGVSHSYYPESKFGTLDLGQNGHANHLYFHDVADVDAAIAELVALKQEMDPPVIGCDCMADAEPAPSAQGTMAAGEQHTCDQMNPETGDWCIAPGSQHADHWDTYGESWTTAAAQGTAEMAQVAS